MASAFRDVLLCLSFACFLRAALSMGGGAPAEPAEPAEPEKPSDPRCNRINADADKRDFKVKASSIYTTGCYESDISADDDGFFVGTFKPKIEMTADLPVVYSLFAKVENNYNPVAGGTDSMQGMLEKFASVVANINCYLSKTLDLPMAMPKDALELNNCEVFPRQFPPGFPPGEYLVNINQTSPKGDEFCGAMDIYFDLVEDDGSGESK